MVTKYHFSLHIFDTDYTSMQRRSADIALQTPLQKRLTSTLNDVLYWKEEGGEIFHALIVWFWDFLGTQWGDIFFQKAFLFLWLSHWEKLLQFVSDFIFSKHYGCTPRGVRGVKRSEILWEIQKCSLPGRPSSQNWIKSKTIYHILMNFDAFLTVFLILLNFGWMVDLAMSIFELLPKFLIFRHP